MLISSIVCLLLIRTYVIITLSEKYLLWLWFSFYIEYTLCMLWMKPAASKNVLIWILETLLSGHHIRCMSHFSENIQDLLIPPIHYWLDLFLLIKFDQPVPYNTISSLKSYIKLINIQEIRVSSWKHTLKLCHRITIKTTIEDLYIINTNIKIHLLYALNSKYHTQQQHHQSSQMYKVFKKCPTLYKSNI